MARYRGPKVRQSRREGMDLFGNTKGLLEKRGTPPGEQGRRPQKVQGYGLQLREKQKVKRIYGVLERQFRIYFKKAAQMKGVTGENLLQMLERRLDNVLFRLGYARTRSQARQLAVHGHVMVNGRKVNIPSYLVKENDEIKFREKSKKLPLLEDAIQFSQGRGVPSWLERNENEFSGKIIAMPDRDAIDLPINEQLIVELYSK